MTVSGRFSDRVGNSPERPLVVGGIRSAGCNDSTPLPVTTGRITTAEADKVIAALAEADSRIVEILAVTRYATGRQIRRLLWDESESGKRLGRHHLSKLTQLRVLSRLDRRIGGARAGSDGYVYALDVIGQRLVDRGQGAVRRPRTPGLAFLAHTLDVAEIYMELRGHEVSQHLELVGFVTEPEAWRRYRMGGRTETLKPDAYAEWLDTDWHHAAFFEVDRGTENPARITRKAKAYISYWRSGIEQETTGMFPKVIWIGPDEHRCGVISNAVAAIEGQTQLFAVTTQEGFAQSLTPGNEGGEEVEP